MSQAEVIRQWIERHLARERSELRVLVQKYGAVTDGMCRHDGVDERQALIGLQAGGDDERRLAHLAQDRRS